jgi:hypothetical protein
MLEILYELSLCYDPDPTVVCRKIVEAVGDHYGGTMAMINLTRGDRQVFRFMVNPHPLLEGAMELPLASTY